MKNKISIVFLLGLFFLISACKNPEIGYEIFTITDESIETEAYYAKVRGSFSFSGNVKEMQIVIAAEESLADAVNYSIILDGNTFSAELDNLLPNQTYYYCYDIDFGGKENYLTDVNSFTTLKGKPFVKTLEVVNISDASYRVKCEVISDGGFPILERGIYWNTNGNPGLNDNKIIHHENGIGEFDCLMDNLEPNTTYYVRAYAKNNIGTGLAQEELPFRTQTDPDATILITTNCNPTNGGTATGGGSFHIGDNCTVHAVANPGYTFVNWTENETIVSLDPDYSFVVTTNRTLVATFTEKEYIITAIAEPEEGGSVTGTGGFSEGEECTLTAIANIGYVFDKWTKDGVFVSSDASYTFSVTESVTYTAHFQENIYNINVVANPSNGGFVYGSGRYHYGQSCTITASANEGFVFMKWTKDDEFISNNNSYTFSVTDDAVFVAQFQMQNLIEVSVSPINGGNVSGGGYYSNGDNCTVTATANNGYEFSCWVEEDLVVSLNASYSFTVNGNRNLVAKFNQMFPVGALNGLFTINHNGNQVYFSKGNLQYICSPRPPRWKFADKQWKFLGNYGQGSDSESVDRDLFGWGTSGWDCQNKFFQPYDTDNSNAAFYGPPGNNDLTGQYANSDWGYYNAISNGGETSKLWRTLSYSEWNYVFFERNTPSGILFAMAKVSGVNGIILLPDNWNADTFVLNETNNAYATFSSNDISEVEWGDYLENNGAVFLPAAGYRSGTSITDEGTKGYYWSSSHHQDDETFSYYISITDGAFQTNLGIEKYVGMSVRLVYPIQ